MDAKRGHASSGKSKKLTPKQAKFAAAYVNPQAASGNGTLAAKFAGYKGDANQLAVQACVNLKNPSVQRTIADALDATGCTLDRAARAVADAMEATKRRCYLGLDGKLTYSAEEPDHRTRLQAAEITFRQRRDYSAQNHGGMSSAADGRHQLSVSSEATTIDGELQNLPPAERVVLRSFLDKVLRIAAPTGTPDSNVPQPVSEAMPEKERE